MKKLLIFLIFLVLIFSISFSNLQYDWIGIKSGFGQELGGSGGGLEIGFNNFGGFVGFGWLYEIRWITGIKYHVDIINDFLSFYLGAGYGVSSVHIFQTLENEVYYGFHLLGGSNIKFEIIKDEYMVINGGLGYFLSPTADKSGLSWTVSVMFSFY